MSTSLTRLIGVISLVHQVRRQSVQLGKHVTATFHVVVVILSFAEQRSTMQQASVRFHVPVVSMRIALLAPSVSDTHPALIPTHTTAELISTMHQQVVLSLAPLVRHLSALKA